jgi:predicted transcriptional regulator
MSTLEEVRNYQTQGLSEDQIIQSLRQKGTRYKDIVDALSQTKIRDAVEQPEETPTPSSDAGYTSQIQGMEPSIMTSMSNQQESAIPQAPVPGASYSDQPYVNPQEYAVPAPGQEYAQYPQQYDQQYANYPQASAMNPDIITEIAEQIVASRFSEIRKHLEKLTDMKSTLDSKVEYLDERLKRIEKIIDVLQTSVLRKVGDYVTNVQDIKSEMIETQKTFAKLVPQIKDSMKTSHHTQQHHHEHHSQHKK